MNLRLFSAFRGFVNSNQPLRTFASTSGGPVKLSFDRYENVKPESASPLLILHGLFGSRQNWRAVSKRLNADLKRSIVAIDARNHGESPRSNDHNYDLLADDLKELYSDLGLQKAAVLGHSMGGRVMINFALKYPNHIEKLIVVDITQFNRSHNSDQIVDMLKMLNDLKLDSSLPLSAARKSTSELMANLGINQATRDFVLLNLYKNSSNDFDWRINLDSLQRNLHDVFNFPQENLKNAQFHGDTLFIGGGESDYIQKQDLGRIRENFPNAHFEFIEGAGHLVHVEKPAKFIEVVTKFLNSH